MRNIHLIYTVGKVIKSTLHKKYKNIKILHHLEHIGKENRKKSKTLFFENLKLEFDFLYKINH